MKTSILFVIAAVVAMMIWDQVNGEDYEVEEQGRGVCRPVKNELSAIQKKLKMIGENVAELETKCYPSCSCEEIKNRYPQSASGFYTIQVKGMWQKVYCNMDTLCGDRRGGWTRIAYLNMADRDQKCPPGFRQYEANGVRACGKQMKGAGCQSIKFPSKDISYTRVCGRVTGYQKGSPDAFNKQFSKRDSLDNAYVDGVSITRGNPRKHVFTFVASLSENLQWCPCDKHCPAPAPSFVGKDYFCETAVTKKWDLTTFHTGDPLWDGKQCGAKQRACCKAPGIPWFNKVLQYPTKDYIELRVCGDQPIRDEDVPVGYYEIYIK